MQDRTGVPFRAGRNLYVHGVVTYGDPWRNRSAHSGACCLLPEHPRDWPTLLEGRDIATTCETCQARGWISTLSPESDYVAFTTGHITHIGSPRSGCFGRETLQRLVKRATGMRIVPTMSPESGFYWRRPLRGTLADINFRCRCSGRTIFTLEPRVTCVKRHVDGELYLETSEQSANVREDMETSLHTSSLICRAASTQAHSLHFIPLCYT